MIHVRISPNRVGTIAELDRRGGPKPDSCSAAKPTTLSITSSPRPSTWSGNVRPRDFARRAAPRRLDRTVVISIFYRAFMFLALHVRCSARSGHDLLSSAWGRYLSLQESPTGSSMHQGARLWLAGAAFATLCTASPLGTLASAREIVAAPVATRPAPS